MKPISELVNDREACERIFGFIHKLREDGEFSHALFREYEGGCYKILLMSTKSSVVAIWMDGTLDSAGRKGFSVEYNPFAFVALMNELGYGPETQGAVTPLLDHDPGKTKPVMSGLDKAIAWAANNSPMETDPDKIEIPYMKDEGVPYFDFVRFGKATDNDGKLYWRCFAKQTHNP